MKTAVIKAIGVTLLVGGGLLAAPTALGAVTRPDVESISGAFTSGDRIHAQLKVQYPVAGRITLELQGYSPNDRKFHASRVGERVFTVAAGRSTYNGYFQDVSRGLSGTNFTKFRIAVESWTVDDLVGTSTVSNVFTRPTSTARPEPSPSSDPEDDSTAAPAPASSAVDSTGLISAGDAPFDTTGGSDGSSATVDAVNPSPQALPQSQAGRHPAAAVAPAVAKQPASAKLLVSAGWTAGGGWMLLLLVPLVAGGAMFAVLSRAER